MGMPESAVGKNGALPREPFPVRDFLGPKGSALTKSVGEFLGDKVDVYVAPPVGDRISIKDPYGKKLLDGNRHGSYYPIENHPGITNPYVEVCGLNVTDGAVGFAENGKVKTATFVLPSEGGIFTGAQIKVEEHHESYTSFSVQPFEVSYDSALVTPQIRHLAALARNGE